MYLRVALCACVLHSAIVVAQPTALPQTAIGRRVEAYLKSFNSADEKVMREFFLHNISEDALRQTPVDTRLDRYRQMRARLGSLELRQIEESTESRIRGLFRSSDGGFVYLEFEFEKAPPFSLIGIRVEDTGSNGVVREPKKDDAELCSSVAEYAGQLEKTDKFSGVILIAHHGEAIWKRAFGYADREKKLSNTVDTRFNIGSINKNFTQLAIHRLVAQGKLSLDDPLKRFLPDYPNREAGEKVTVRHLLEMTSGIGDIFNERYESIPKEKLRSITDFIPLFADKPLEFEPGTQRRYSNGGYVLLGAIIEKVTGVDYYSHVRKTIFEPAGMTETGYYSKDESIPNRSVGYVLKGSALVDNYSSLPGRGSSAGGGYSTARDLLKYALYLRDNSPQSSGLGIAGGAPGLNAALESNVHNGYVIVVLANLDPPVAENMARRIRSWLPR